MGGESFCYPLVWSYFLRILLSHSSLDLSLLNSYEIDWWFIDIWAHRPIYLIILRNLDSLPLINQLIYSNNQCFLWLFSFFWTSIHALLPKNSSPSPLSNILRFSVESFSPQVPPHLRLGRPPSFHKRLRLHRTQAWSLQCPQSKINPCRKSPHTSQRCGPATRRQSPLWSQSWRSRSSWTICWTRSLRGATIPTAPGSAGRFAICWARCRSMSSSYTTQVHFFHSRPHS